MAKCSICAALSFSGIRTDSFNPVFLAFDAVSVCIIHSGRPSTSSLLFRDGACARRAGGRSVANRRRQSKASPHWDCSHRSSIPPAPLRRHSAARLRIAQPHPSARCPTVTGPLADEQRAAARRLCPPPSHRGLEASRAEKRSVLGLTCLLVLLHSAAAARRPPSPGTPSPCRRHTARTTTTSHRHRHRHRRARPPLCPSRGRARARGRPSRIRFRVCASGTEPLRERSAMLSRRRQQRRPLRTAL